VTVRQRRRPNPPPETRSEPPPAVAALIAAVIEANVFAPPWRQAQLVTEELALQGWHVGAPGTCRPTTSAAGPLQSATDR
jgi:hypothetical protein